MRIGKEYAMTFQQEENYRIIIKFKDKRYPTAILFCTGPFTVNSGRSFYVVIYVYKLLKSITSSLTDDNSRKLLHYLLNHMPR